MQKELSGFLVLPDCDEAAAQCPTSGVDSGFQVLTHPSGRPWLVAPKKTGKLGEGDGLISASAGTTRLAVIGWSTIGESELGRWAEKVNSLADIDQLAARLHGSQHLLASVDGAVRFQGTVSGVRGAYYAVHRGVTLASDRADVLAAVTGAGLDEASLAVRLLIMSSSALARPVWRGIDMLATDSYLKLDTDGRADVVPYWTPPQPELGLEAGAVRLHTALAQSVAARAGRTASLGADLSGGLDSTPLCFLAADAAAASGGRLTTLRIAVDDPAHDDHVWASRAASALADGDVRHHVFTTKDVPHMFAAVGEPITGVDEPVRWIRSIERLRFTAKWLAGTGAEAHLTGHGGDEVLVAKPNYLHDLTRRRPVLARRHFAALRAMKRWSLAAGVRELADRSSYPQWLRQQSTLLSDAFPSPHTPPFGWEYPLRMPPWASAEANRAAAGRVREAAGSVRPFSQDRAPHLTIDLVRQVGAAVRQGQLVTGSVGTPLHAPYLDDRVVEACLSVRSEERTSPWTYKPLMAEAMKDRMPADSLRRGTKGEFSDDLQRGLHRHRDQLATLFDDPVVGRLGLVDVDQLRRAALSAYPPGLPMAALDTSMAVENWLRAQERTKNELWQEWGEGNAGRTAR
ncbi:asparagine synthase-related protein [Streptomyces sp. NPDC007100]|uniref:asparagine synthase-related protein n=1 Tax=Streptomyces sp. NPDC007100 TaxID=3155602 RepID=UPI0033F05000